MTQMPVHLNGIHASQVLHTLGCDVGSSLHKFLAPDRNHLPTVENQSVCVLSLWIVLTIVNHQPRILVSSLPCFIGCLKEACNLRVLADSFVNHN
jgi:hypothetical protein